MDLGEGSVTIRAVIDMYIAGTLRGSQDDGCCARNCQGIERGCEPEFDLIIAWERKWDFFSTCTESVVLISPLSRGDPRRAAHAGERDDGIAFIE